MPSRRPRSPCSMARASSEMGTSVIRPRPTRLKAIDNPPQHSGNFSPGTTPHSRVSPRTRLDIVDVSLCADGAIPAMGFPWGSSDVGVHRCSCGYPPSPREGPALWETLKVATFAIPQSHSVDCKAERVRPGRCGNDTPIVPSASWRRSKTVTRNGRRTSPRRRGTSRLTAGTSGVRCCASKTPVGISRLYLCAARRHTPEL